MNGRIESWLSIPKSLYVCYRLLPWKQAIMLPIRVRYNVKLQSLKGKAVISGQIHKAMVMIGFQHVGTHDVTYRRAVLEIDGEIEFRGKALIGSGSQICVGNNGHLTLGDGFINSCSGHVVCHGKMMIGKSFFMGWDVLMLDTDFHEIENVITNERSDVLRNITIGDNVWIGTRVVILKGCQIPDGCIIGANSVVTGRYEKPNCIIAGNPARVVKEGYRRKL